MRHLKHRNQLGVKKEHRTALIANLASALIKEGRITTTLKKAKALRPFAEKLVTLAKNGELHHRRLAVARIRDREAVRILFDEKVEEFRSRNGGYTRIYKIGTRIGDAAEMALIEWVGADDVGYRSTRRKAGKKAVPATAPEAEETAAEVEAVPEPEAEAGDPDTEVEKAESSDEPAADTAAPEDEKKEQQ
jgi:large subunit ribosomal protein L17